MSDNAATNSKPPHKVGEDDPRAIALLKEEHQTFRTLFDRAEQAEGKALVTIAQELCLRLDVHMTIEEEILYPALKAAIGDDEVNEGIVEHQSAKRLIEEIEQLNGDEPLYASKVHVLGEETIHHIDEEDEELFEKAKEAHRAGKIDLDAIGDRLRDRQRELYARIESTGEEGPTAEANAEEVETVNGRR